jgi:hypothetical protein
VACNVTSTADSGTGSLRDIAALCSGTTITFDPSLNGHTITVLSAIPIGNNTTLQGPGASSLTISGGGSTQILNASADATVSGLTFTKGATTAYGGAIHANGTLTVAGCVFSANTGLSMSLGGAIDASAVAITGSTFTGNTAYYAGALHITNNNGSSSSSISDSTFVSNSGTGSLAGAILNYTNLTITGSTFSGNSASSHQDIMTYGAMTITNSTFAGPFGSNIGVYNGVNVSITASTLSAAGIFINSGGATQLTNSIVYSLIQGTFTSGGYNLINSTGSATFTPTTGDQVGVTPPLDALGNYGGPTQTLMLTLGTNPAIGAIPQANCPLTSDQRGQPRPSSLHPGFCDIGAVERQSSDSVYP